MPFINKRKIEFTYQSPVEMYKDNKSGNKKIMGLLDYQRDMLEGYMTRINRGNIAIEMPTGSGKTLVGLLIGEFRRRKEHEKVVYLCPTKQLVHQVVEQANNNYGLKAIAFCGKQADYNEKDKNDFLRAEVIAVTTYSAFFVQNTFFSDVDIIIMDDVHSSESYIVDNWTLNFGREDEVFPKLALFFKKFIGEIEYKKLVGNDEEEQTDSWCNTVPNGLIKDDYDLLDDLIDKELSYESGSNFFVWNRIRENLKECNIYVEKGRIQIRPWIAPTMTHVPFKKAKQRILMSATLGKGGELERVTGLSKIEKLPIVNEWDKKGVGRKFFIIPRLSLGQDSEAKVLVELHKIAKRSVVLTPSKRKSEIIEEIAKNSIPKIKIYTVNDLEENKKEFIQQENAMVIMANRFDGVDFPDDESRLLVISALPRVTNIQEKFLVSRMGATKLYAERIRTRIIQAVGRCTRNTRDYSIVCILGNTIINDLIEPKKLQQFPPELRAEIEFGIENSLEYKNIQEIIDNAHSFLKNDDEWQEAQETIVAKRDDFSIEDAADEHILSILQEIADVEVDFQYAMWKKSYKEAFVHVKNIIEKLKAQKLNGYKSYWNYVGGTLAHYLVQMDLLEYKKIGEKMFQEVLKDNISVKWMVRLQEELFSSNSQLEEYDYMDEIIPQIEVGLMEYTNETKIRKKIIEIESYLNDQTEKSGQRFEHGHYELGKMLGYISKNNNTSGAPDPYWLVGDLCFVSEDKVYKSDKKIPISDAREVSSHRKWIIENEPLVTSKTNIIVNMISNATKLDIDGKHIVDDIYYLNKEEFTKWAAKALEVIAKLKMTFIEAGDAEWRTAACKMMKAEKVTPLDFKKLCTKTWLKDIAE